MKLIDQCKTLQDFKDLVAIRKQYIDFTDCVHWIKDSRRIQELTDEASKLYAIEKVKEALKLAAERAEVIYHDGVNKHESSHSMINIGNNHMRPNRELILSLETELLNQINKEK